MKVNYVKLGFLALLFICFYSMKVGYADIIWSDDFEDGDLDGWTIGLGEWAVTNGTLQGQDHDPVQQYCMLNQPSTVVYGTWSFDIKLKPFKNLYIAFIDSNGSFADFGYYYELKIAPQSVSTQFIFYKQEGSHADTLEALYNHEVYDGLHGAWHHVDITREPNGKFSFYLDTELLFEVIDNNIITSETFALTSQQYGAFVDNIEVSDEIRIWSDDFNDGDLDGWTIGLGEWAIINGTIQGQDPDPVEPYCTLYQPSIVAYGTWSFDVKLQLFKSLVVSFINYNETFKEFGYWYFFYMNSLSNSTQFTVQKNEGVWPDTLEVLYTHIESDELHDVWHHIDITRDINGKFSFYLDAELLFEVVDNMTSTCEELGIISKSYGAFVDNIVVTDFVKDPMDVNVEIEVEQVTQGEDVILSIQIRDEFGIPIEGVSVEVRVGDKEVSTSEQPNGVYHALVDTSDYLGTVELVVTSRKAEYLFSKTTHSIEVVSPAEFVSSGLSIEPSSTLVGETVVISAEVSNVGGREGSHSSVLSIQGVPTDQYQVTLVPGGSETVTFEYVPTQPGTFTVYLDDLTGSLSVVEPASFEVSSLIIDPASLKEGESVTISVTCSNVGGASGSYDVVLKIDGMTEDESTVNIDAGESTTVSFDVSASKSGTYSVDVNGLSGSYEVTKQQQGIPGFPFESLLLGLISGVLLLFILQRNKISNL